MKKKNMLAVLGVSIMVLTACGATQQAATDANSEEASEEVVEEVVEEATEDVQEETTEESEEAAEETNEVYVKEVIEVSDYQELSDIVGGEAISEIGAGYSVIDEDNVFMNDWSYYNDELYRLSKKAKSITFNGSSVEKFADGNDMYNIIYRNPELGGTIELKFYYADYIVVATVHMSDDESLYQKRDGARYPGYAKCIQDPVIWYKPVVDVPEAVYVKTSNDVYWYFEEGIKFKPGF